MIKGVGVITGIHFSLICMVIRMEDNERAFAALQKVIFYLHSLHLYIYIDNQRFNYVENLFSLHFLYIFSTFYCVFSTFLRYLGVFWILFLVFLGSSYPDFTL